MLAIKMVGIILLLCEGNTTENRPGINTWSVIRLSRLVDLGLAGRTL